MKQMLIVLFVISLSPIVGADLIITPINTAAFSSEQIEGKEVHVFNIDFDITSIGNDVQLSQDTNTDRGFVWEYEKYSGGGPFSISPAWSFSYTREAEAYDHTYFHIQDGETREIGVGMAFHDDVGTGQVRANLIGGHTTEGEYFPIGITTQWWTVSGSVVPEPSTFALILLGALLLRKR